jgi:hypothetical protein
VENPTHWDLWVQAAKTYLETGSWGEAGTVVQRTYTTLQRWRADPRWPDAVKEAELLWNQDVRNDALKGMHDKIKEGDGQMIRFYMERRDKAFAPPTQKTEHTGAIKVKTTVRFIKAKDGGT